MTVNGWREELKGEEVVYVNIFPLADRKPNMFYYCCKPEEFNE